MEIYNDGDENLFLKVSADRTGIFVKAFGPEGTGRVEECWIDWIDILRFMIKENGGI